MFFFHKEIQWPEISHEEIKKRARLLVIDDKEFPYLVLFKRDGYTIDKWSDISDLTKLEEGYYDIILLDLQGVGLEYSAEQGLGILKHLHEKNPTQIIIAYSSADWPLKYQDFFQMADGVLAKSSDYVDFKKKVDQLLDSRFSLGFYFSRIHDILKKHVEEPEKFDKLIKKSMKSQEYSKLRKSLQNNIPESQTVDRILRIIQIAVTIAAML